jgi:parallel beta-helix repeat protein
MVRPLVPALVLGVLTVALSPAPSAAAVLACGDAIVADTVLENNLLDCPGDGIVIGADGITLNLAGRIVDGTGGPTTAGIRLNGRSSVTIGGGGVVREFGLGVSISGGQLDRVTSLVLAENAVGVFVINSNDNTIDRNVVYAPNIGIHLVGSLATGNTIRGNEVYGAVLGIQVTVDANGTEIEDNDCHDNQDGIRLANADSNNVRGNRLSGNNQGLRINGDVGTSDSNLVRSNVFTSNATGVFLDAVTGGTNANIVRDNRFADNNIGVRVLGAGNVNNRIVRNTFSAHVVDTIDDTGTGTVTNNNNCVPADPDCL